MKLGLVVGLAVAVSACAPVSTFVVSVQPLTDGSVSVTTCDADRDFWGRNVVGECHTTRRRPRDP